MRLVYWISDSWDDRACYSIRERTRSGCIAQRRACGVERDVTSPAFLRHYEGRPRRKQRGAAKTRKLRAAKGKKR